MKKFNILVFLLLVFITFAYENVYAVSDGSLKINTGIEQNREPNEILYIEQENELSKLFLGKSSKLINDNKKRIKKQEEPNKDELFIKKIESREITASYRKILFTSSSPTMKSDYEITLNDNSKRFSWKMILIIFIGVSITIYSLFNKALRKEHSRKWTDT